MNSPLTTQQWSAGNCQCLVLELTLTPPPKPALRWLKHLECSLYTWLWRCGLCWSGCLSVWEWEHCVFDLTSSLDPELCFWKVCVLWSYMLLSKNCRVPALFPLPPDNLNHHNLVLCPLQCLYRNRPLDDTSWRTFFCPLWCICDAFVMQAASYSFLTTSGECSQLFHPQRNSGSHPHCCWRQTDRWEAGQTQSTPVAEAAAAGGASGMRERLFGERRLCWRAVILCRARCQLRSACRRR